MQETGKKKDEGGAQRRLPSEKGELERGREGQGGKRILETGHKIYTERVIWGRGLLPPL